MRNPIVKRITAGLAAAMLMFTNVLLPVQPAFANNGVGNGGGSSTTVDEVESTGTNQPVWCQMTGNIWTAQIGVSGGNPNRFPLTELPEGHSKEIYIDEESGQVYAPNSSDDVLKGQLDAYCAMQYELEIPAAPGVNDPCGDNNATWMVPADTDILEWTVDNDGHLIVTIVKDGYVFTDGEYTHDYGVAPDSGVPCEPEKVVIPAKLSAEDPCGLDNIYLITTAFDSIDNISYVVNKDGSVTVTADEGYRLIVDGTQVPDYKNYTYPAVKDSGVLCEALSEKPKFVDPCGTTNDYYQVEKTEYVEYYNGEELLKAGKKYYVTDASEVTITAKVTNEDYEIVNDTVYTHQFTNEPCVELDAKAWCDDLDTKIKVVLTNTTKKSQRYEVVITSGDEEVYSEVVRLKKNETETMYTKLVGDGEFTVSIYAMKGKKRGELLTQKTVETLCVDTFTPEIYKKNQDGAILSTGTFDVEVCQMSSEFDRMVMGEEQDGCTTYEDVMFGTDGTWFANNVEYERNVPTTVTITETKAPVGCAMSTTPWVFTWSYNDIQVMSYYHMSGSWDTVDGTNVFNLYNNCDKPGQGEYTPTPVVPVEDETLAETGESENAIFAVAAGMLLASVGLALTPRLYRGQA